MLRSRHALVCGIAVVACVAGVAAPAGAASQGYGYHRLVVTRSGDACSNLVANSENNHGTVLGTVYCGKSDGFVKRGKRVRFFQAPGSANTMTESTGIADDGKAVLVTQVNYTGPYTAYLRSTKGHFTKLADPHAGKYGTYAEGVNSRGEVVGYYFVKRSSSTIKPFIDRHGHFSSFSLGVKGARDIQLIGVNKSGDIAGSFVKHGTSHGFVDIHGKVRVVNAPGAGHGNGLGTQVVAISDNAKYWCGVAVFGGGTEYQDTSSGFVYHGGHFRTVRVPKSWGHTTVASDVDDAGTVVGLYIYSNDVSWQRRGFVAKPGADAPSAETAARTTMPPAGTAGAAKHHALPNPCDSFTNARLATLLGAPAHTTFHRKHGHNSDGPNCTVSWQQYTFVTTLDRKNPGLAQGPDAHYYYRPKLGKYGYVEVDDLYSNARGRIDKFFFVDDVNKRLSHKGAKMYHFALAERHRLGKG